MKRLAGTVAALEVVAFAVFFACAPGPPRPLEAENPPASASASSTAPVATPNPLPVTPEASQPPKLGKVEARPPDRIAARHILIQYMGCTQASSSVVRTREQARAVAEEVLKRLRAGADFARLAVDFSDEPGAAQRGGALGRFDRKAMDKAFAEAAFALRVNEISAIVETPFGFHIIQRTE